MNTTALRGKIGPETPQLKLDTIGRIPRSERHRLGSMATAQASHDMVREAVEEVREALQTPITTEASISTTLASLATREAELMPPHSAQLQATSNRESQMLAQLARH